MYISVADNRGASTESYSNEGGGGGGEGREGRKPAKNRECYNVLLTAPLQRSLMVPSGNCTTTDIRFLVLGRKEGQERDLTNTRINTLNTC